MRISGNIVWKKRRGREEEEGEEEEGGGEEDDDEEDDDDELGLGILFSWESIYLVYARPWFNH